MTIPFLRKSSFDSLERQETNVLRIADDRRCISVFKIQPLFITFFHKILTEILHQSRLTNKHECKVIMSSFKISKISFKQSVDILCQKKKKNEHAQTNI